MTLTEQTTQKPAEEQADVTCSVAEVVSDEAVPLHERCDRLKRQLRDEDDDLRRIPLKNYDKLDSLKTTTKATEVLLRHIEQQVREWGDAVTQIREGLTSLTRTTDRKLLDEGLPKWIADLNTDPTGKSSFLFFTFNSDIDIRFQTPMQWRRRRKHLQR